MALLWVVASADPTVTVLPSAFPSPSPPVPLASLHRTALLALWKAMGGSKWIYPNTIKGARWDFTTGSSGDPCLEGWAGVTCACSAQESVIMGLSLKGMTTTTPSGLYSLPSEIGLLTDLVSLDVSSNSLSGAIPSSLSSCLALHTLNLGGNQFVGTVPDLSPLKNLVYFSVASSQLSGNFPKFLLQLPEAQHIDLLRNSFTGRIPKQIGGLTGLTYLGLDKCAFSGTIPSNLGLLTRLAKLAVNGNKLSAGTLPSSLGNLVGLTYLGVHFSALTGTIPKNIGRISSLIGFRANDNLFRGTVPSTFSGLSFLQQLDLFNNTGLTGTLPSGLFGMSSLTKLDVSNCSLGGPLGSMQAWGGMQYLSLHTNVFTGPLKLGSASSFPNLGVFYAQRCQLVGKIPRNLGTVMPKLTSLILSENNLVGSVPRSIGSLSSLITLKLDNNRLTNGDTFGDASFVSGCKALQFLGLTANYFTGPLSPNFFSLPSPQLHTIALSSNCLHGTVPEALCRATSLQFLIMDGLAAGTACRRLFFPNAATLGAQLNGRMSQHTFHGPIPECVFALPRLKTLHLGGNGLGGSLPNSIVTLPPNLTDISLANNLLVGTIPPAFQILSKFSLFDLSYSMISGGLLPEMTTSPSLSLKLRLMRLSGPVPAGVLKAGSVDILEGNMWACGDARDSLPPNDPFLHNFQCGSIAFDKYVYAFLSVGAAAVIMMYLVGGEGLISISGRSRSVFTFKKLENLNRAFKNLLCGLPNVNVLTHILLYTRKIAFIIAGGAVAALVPIYGILSLTSGTYQSEYSWTVSGIFKGGTAPAVVLLLCWSVAIVGTNILILHYFRADIDAIKKRKDEREESKKTAGNVPSALASEAEAQVTVVAGSSVDAVTAAAAAERTRVSRRNALIQVLLFARLLVIVFINCTATLAANIIYVDLAEQSDAVVQMFSKIVLSLFKLVWNLQVLRFLCGPTTVDYIAVLVGAEHDEMKEVQKTLTVLKGASIFELILIIFNNIIAPVCATAFVEPQCFHHVFYALPPVETSYEVMDCTSSPKYGLGGVIDTKSVKTNCYNRATSSQYDPDFTYTNQCSSVLIQFYAPVLMLVTLWPTFGRPLKNYLLRLFLNLDFWGAEQGLGGAAAAGESLQAAQRWAARRGYYFFLLKGLSNKLLWTDRELAFRKEIDAHAVAYLYSLKDALTLPRTLVVNPLSSPARPKEPEATGGEMELDAPAPSDRVGPASAATAPPTLTSPRRHRRYKFVDVPQFFLETLSDLTSLLTFGLICPVLGVALGGSIVSRTMQWQYGLVNFLLRRKGAFASTIPTDAERHKLDAVLCEELDQDCSKIYSGANPTKANWLLSLFSVGFLGFFLLDMAASSSFNSTESGTIVENLWAPFLLLLIPTLSVVLFRERLLAIVGSRRIQKRAEREAGVRDGGRGEGKEGQADKDERESQEGEFNKNNTVPEAGDAATRSSESVLSGAPDSAEFDIHLIHQQDELDLAESGIEMASPNPMHQKKSAIVILPT